MKSEGESSLSGTLKQKHQSAVETHTTTASKDNTHKAKGRGKSQVRGSTRTGQVRVLEGRKDVLQSKKWS